MQGFTLSGWLKRAFSIVAITGLMAATASVGLGASSQAQTARDCDNNAVMHCGALSYEELVTKYRANANHTQSIFREFGITNEDALSGMVSGRVTSDNKIYVGDTLVATNAVTVGRQNMPGSTPILDGIAYKRPPSVSFASGSLHAFVKMDGPVFKYAVISSCGNPVVATPTQQPEPKTPDFSVVKQVKNAQNQWVEQVTVKPTEHVEFRIIVKNTGETELKNIVVKDVLPSGLTYASELRLNGQANNGQLVGAGVTLPSLAVGQEAVMTFKATAVAANCEAGHKNVVTVQPEGQQPKQDDAVVKVCVPRVDNPTPTPEQPKPQPPAPTPPATTQEQPQAVRAARTSQPTILPATGPAGILGTFLGVSSGAALLHNRWQSRRK